MRVVVIKGRRRRNLPASNKDLEKRAQRLNRKYFQGKLTIKGIRWSRNQHSLFGSCSSRKGTIRISATLAKQPSWVLEATIIHELTHLLVPRHGKRFWQIANQYPFMERARGYLIALSRLSRKT